jgi:hypothetical protein
MHAKGRGEGSGLLRAVRVESERINFEADVGSGDLATFRASRAPVHNSANTTRASLATCILLSVMAGFSGCATESHQALQVEKPAAAAVTYQGIRKPIAVGSFDNRSAYLRGIFSDGVGRLGGQAKTILIGHLQETGRFNVLARDDMRHLAEEAKLSGKQLFTTADKER